MSKITFRADDDLVERVERLDASKSEVMREALRLYLDEYGPAPDDGEADRAVDPHGEGVLDGIVAERVDTVLEERLGSVDPEGRDVNLTISLEGVEGASVERGGPAGGHERTDPDAPVAEPSGGADGRTCGQCGETVSGDHVYCPNCGEKATRRVFCDCGDELRSDWGFCPSCGRRTPAADVLDGG